MWERAGSKGSWKSRPRYLSLSMPYVENICKIKTKHLVSNVSSKATDPCEIMMWRKTRMGKATAQPSCPGSPQGHCGKRDFSWRRSTQLLLTLEKAAALGGGQAPRRGSCFQLRLLGLTWAVALALVPWPHLIPWPCLAKPSLGLIHIPGTCGEFNKFLSLSS